MALLNEVRDKLWKALSRGYTSTISGLFLRNADDQMKASWARSVKPGDVIPEVFREFFESSRLEGQEFPYAVLTPSYDGFIHREVQKLICDFGHEIDVLERNGNSFYLQCYPIERISYVEVKTILLNSQIKICGVTKEGVPNSSTFRFSSLTDYLFTPILQRIRHAPVDSKSSPHCMELEKFEPWRRENYKFMNYAKRSLLAGEKVIHTILQPEIRETVLQFLGRAYSRFVAPALACILTDQELIMIQEEKSWGGEDKYGGIWDYIPVNKIMSLSLNEKENNLLALSIHLTEGTRLEYLFQPSARREINRLQDRFMKLIMM